MKRFFLFCLSTNFHVKRNKNEIMTCCFQFLLFSIFFFIFLFPKILYWLSAGLLFRCKLSIFVMFIFSFVFVYLLLNQSLYFGEKRELGPGYTGNLVHFKQHCLKRQILLSFCHVSSDFSVNRSKLIISANKLLWKPYIFKQNEMEC